MKTVSLTTVLASLLALTSTASAEVIVYEFTADVAWSQDGSGIFAAGGISHSTLTGTFTYDTDSGTYDSTVSDSVVGGYERTYSRSHPSGDSVKVDGIDTVWAPGTTTRLYVLDAQSASYSDVIDNIDYGNGGAVNGVDFDFGQEGIYFRGPQDTIDDDAVPAELDLADWADAYYYTYFRNGDGYSNMRANLTSLTRLRTVPELDPSASGSAACLLLGGLFVIGARRRQTV